MRLKKVYSFNDVLCLPKYSTISSRADVDISTTISGLPLKIPIIAANMSTVCEDRMAIALGELGGLGVIHRFTSVEQQAAIVKKVHDAGMQVGFAIGIGEDWRTRMDACRHYADIVVIDVAHGHTDRVFEIIKKYYGIYKSYPIVLSQFGTGAAIADLVERVIPSKCLTSTSVKGSIGGGSHCLTRIATGHGNPTLQFLFEAAERDLDISIIADGGLKSSADVVKSLAAGASAVMLGYMLSGCDEAPGDIIVGNDGHRYRHYMGSASFSQKRELSNTVKNVEGASSLVPATGSVKDVVNKILDGLRSGMSYSGARTIDELQRNVEFIEVSLSGYTEGTAHGVALR
jgi:IMP dehydrogenase